MHTLEDRIADAFAKTTPSADIERLIARARSASESAGRRADEARERALDPALSSKAVDKARREMEDAAFKRDRLATAVGRLEDRLKEAMRAEEDDTRWKAYNKAKTERDALADEMKKVYPSLASQLADLAERIAANDRRLEVINRAKLPENAARLRSAESVARELGHLIVIGSDVPRITKHMKLPAFNFTSRRRYEWPRGSESLGS